MVDHHFFTKKKSLQIIYYAYSINIYRRKIIGKGAKKNRRVVVSIGSFFRSPTEIKYSYRKKEKGPVPTV